MNKFRKSKSKLAIALLSTLFCNGNGTSAMNTGNLSNRKSSLSVNSNSDSKSAQNLGAVGGATSGNIRINNSNNNKFFDYVKNHKWQFGVGGLSVATVITLATVGGKYLSKKNDDPDKGPGPGPGPGKDKKYVPDSDDKNKAEKQSSGGDKRNIPGKDDGEKLNKNESEGHKSESSEEFEEISDANKKSFEDAFEDCARAKDFKTSFEELVLAVTGGRFDGKLGKHLNNIKEAFLGNLKMENVRCEFNNNGVCGLMFKINDVLYCISCDNISCGFHYVDGQKWQEICRGTLNEVR